MTMQNSDDVEKFSDKLRQFCLTHPAAIIDRSKDQLYLAINQLPASELTDELAFYCQCSIKYESWPLAQIEAWLQQNYCQPQLDAASLVHATASDSAQTRFSAALWLDQLFIFAIQQRASDIHLEPQENGSRLRMRIDGVLHTTHHLNSEQSSSAITRLKILANMDIGESRRPQDGQLTVEDRDQRYNIRLATLPTCYGEKLVLRLIPSLKQSLSLNRLGLSPRELDIFYQTLATPQGLIVVTGPTGSGKTSTLYSLMNYLNSNSLNLCSVEDPIEVPIPGINQTQINRRAGLDFPHILRALLRQDPDIIMIGEIRDHETAEIAINAALTGHLVLSTLHTNSACDTLNRLCQMQIPHYLLASTLRLVVAQRLLRRLCPHCRQLITASPSDISLPYHWRAAGCEHCFDGYYGRLALFELLPITTQIISILIDNPTTHQLQDIATASGVHSLYQVGVMAVQQGLTSFDELLRVVGTDITGKINAAS